MPMAQGVNRVILIGRLGADPELRYVREGLAKTTFRLVTDESYKDKSGTKVERAEWHNIVMWRSTAEAAGKYLKKGSLVYLEGRITSRSYNDKEGNKKYVTEIEAKNMTMLDSRKATGETADVAGETAEFENRQDSDDLPF